MLLPGRSWVLRLDDRCGCDCVKHNVFMMVVVMIELVVVVMVVVVVITLHCSPSALGGWWGCSSKVAAHCLGFGWSGSRAFSLSTIKCHFHYYYHHYHYSSWSDHRYHHFHLNIQRFNNYFHFPHLNVPQSHISNIGAVEQVWVLNKLIAAWKILWLDSLQI